MVVSTSAVYEPCGNGVPRNFLLTTCFPNSGGSRRRDTRAPDSLPMTGKSALIKYESRDMRTIVEQIRRRIKMW